MIVELTEGQQEAKIRESRLRVALEEAPETLAHLRALIEGNDGRGERGEVFTYARTPLLTHVADDADLAFSLLVRWVARWSRVLDVTLPNQAVKFYRTKNSEPLGFAAGTTPESARLLTDYLTSWLRGHGDEISRRDDAAQYQDQVARMVWQIRSARGLTKPREVTRALVRECPYGHLEVTAVYFGEPLVQAELRGEFDFPNATADERRDPTTKAGRQILDAVEGVRVRCGYCGWSARPKVSEIAGWLG
jgi:hypothetical protein